MGRLSEEMKSGEKRDRSERGAGGECTGVYKGCRWDRM